MSNTDNRFYLIVGFSLIAGIGLCIGGIFAPPLLIPGGVLITGSLGALTALIAKKRVSTPKAARPDAPTEQPAARERTPSISIAIDNRSVTFTPLYDGAHAVVRPPTPAPNLREQRGLMLV